MSCITGCSSIAPQNTDILSQSVSQSVKEAKPYTLNAGDRIAVKFYYDPELNQELVIRPDGMISLQLINEVNACGLTPADLQVLLKEKYSKILVNPELTIIALTFSSEKVYVGGEVSRPGMVALTGGMTAFQAIMQAGGYKDTGKMESVVVIRNQESEKPLFLTINLNLESNPQNGFNDIPIQPYDVVFIPMSTISKMGQFVDQYFKKLLPVTLNAGFNWLYEINK